jgi:NAD(P)-dependent dehydrogenase (short-subunit alcohol dehydrogenase family)
MGPAAVAWHRCSSNTLPTAFFEMATGTRSLDILVFGASGFTGQLLCKYLAEHGPPTMRWGICGRSLKKLESIRASLKGLACEPQTALVADSSDVASIDAAVKQVRRCSASSFTCRPLFVAELLVVGCGVSLCTNCTVSVL